MLIKERGDKQIYPRPGVQLVRAKLEKTASENVGKKRGEKKLSLAALLSFIFAKQM